MLQTHTIAPSPARLGLTAPNSPPLPKPPPPSTTTTAASSALLPFLPPLSRAQTLLQQMSSLATRLFDVSSARALWLSSYRGSLPSFISSPPPGPAPPDLPSVSSTKSAVELFSALQTQLFSAVAELQQILDLQDSKVRVSGEIRKKDATLLSFANKIKEAENVLHLIVHDYSDYRRSRSKRLKIHGDYSEEDEEAKGSAFIDINDILSYAHRISYTTFAPPEFGAGQVPLRGALPPAPQDEQMRASQLYRVTEIDVGMQKAPDAKDKTTDKVVEVLIEPTPPREELLPPPSWLPSNLPIQLPPVPPGWKPGDPIPLPLLDGFLPPPHKAEDQPTISGPVMPPILPPMQPRQPKAIEVKHVQLDINPEDEYDSEYSSDIGSSEDDDED